VTFVRRLVAPMCATVCATLGCTGPQTPAPAVPLHPAEACRYAATFEAGRLTVDMSCDGDVQTLVASEAPMASLVTMRTAGVERDGAVFTPPPGTRAVTYRIDLDEVAALSLGVDVVQRASHDGRTAWITAVSTWVLRPQPLDPELTVHVTVKTDEGFATGLRRDGDGYALLGREVRNATYAVFGDFDTEVLRLPASRRADRPEGSRAELELVTLPGAFTSSAKERSAWVMETARAVTRFWHGFPVSHALLALVPAPGDKMVHGKVVSPGGAAIALLLGEEMRDEALFDDWILVHELFHLGVPSFAREGEWLDEGLATYYEPIIRARAGFRDAAWVWRELEGGMGLGLDAVERTGLDRSQGVALYWGGAIVALLADVDARRRSEGALGLEDGLRAVLEEGGDATVKWDLDRFVATVDGRIGAPSLATLVERHQFRGAAIALPDLWRDLGMQRNGDAVSFDETAPLAAVRRAIIASRAPRP
jgi:hypothetical protein